MNAVSGGPTHDWVVGPDGAGMRLDRFLAAQPELGTRSQVQRLIAANCVQVNGALVKGGTVLRVGQRVRVACPPSRPSTLEAEAIALDVLYEDASVLAINKPPGLVVHPAPGHWQGTLVNALLYRWRDAQPADLARMGIVHRLDKDTSGVLIIARDAAALAELGRQFRSREVRKQYLALACGQIKPAGGVIRKPIGRHPVQRKRMAVRERGREATTRYEVLERFAQITLVRLYPETGRTHQIRVHLAAIGHPIVADATYGGARAAAPVAIQRQALHAESIGFRHPLSGDAVTVEAPLAADFGAALDALRGGRRRAVPA